MVGVRMMRGRSVMCLVLLLAVLITGMNAGAAGPVRAASLPEARSAPATGPRMDGSGVLSRIDAPTKAQLQHIWEVGQMLGQRPTVFARVGDSITASGSFLSDIGDG